MASKWKTVTLISHIYILETCFGASSQNKLKDESKVQKDKLKAVAVIKGSGGQNERKITKNVLVLALIIAV